jgi:hypothetical protein
MDFLNEIATILQLIGMYRQEVGQRGDTSTQDFMAWLATHRHEKLKDLIGETVFLQEQVSALLREDFTKVKSQLESLSSLTMALVARFDGLAPIGEAAASEVRLPAQAMDILSSAVKNKGTGFEFISMMGGVLIVLIPSGTAGHADEPAFLEEDCDLLCDVGYLRKAYNTSGKPRYTLTRAGTEFGRTLLEKEAGNLPIQSIAADSTVSS